MWEHIIRETLNKNCSDKSRFKCHNDPPSLPRFNPSDVALSMEHELRSDSDKDSDGELHPLIDQNHNCGLQGKIDENFEAFPEEDLACDVIIDKRAKKKGPEFVRIISKQMVGIFLSIWVRRSLRKHIQNLRVSTVGVGVMGYIGNKASAKFGTLSSFLILFMWLEISVITGLYLVRNLGCCLSHYVSGFQKFIFWYWHSLKDAEKAN